MCGIPWPTTQSLEIQANMWLRPTHANQSPLSQKKVCHTVIEQNGTPVISDVTLTTVPHPWRVSTPKPSEEVTVVPCSAGFHHTEFHLISFWKKVLGQVLSKTVAEGSAWAACDTAEEAWLIPTPCCFQASSQNHWDPSVTFVKRAASPSHLTPS